MVESPAINRENYVVFTAYTMENNLHEKAPIISGKDLPAVKRPANSGGDFSGCYANLKGRSKSVIMPAWCDFNIGWRGGLFVESPDYGIEFNPHNDATYSVDNAEIIKFVSPWMVTTSKPEVNWIAAKSLHNKTSLAIPSGITAWDASLMVLPFFVYIPIVEGYFVDVKMNDPLMSFYPMTDLPIHVETYFDPDKVQELYGKQLEALENRKFASFYLDRKHNEKKTCPQNVS